MARWWIAATGLLLLAALIQFPAAWIAPRLASATHERWRLASVDGTIWNGRGTLYAVDGASGRWLPGRPLKWRVLWGALARARLAARIEVDEGGMGGGVGGGPGRA